MKISIDVCYALPDRQVLRQVQLDSPATIDEVIAASGLAAEFPEIDLTTNKVGIFGKRLAPDAVLNNGDRVEIYRPLVADPKESRRRRAEHAKRTKPRG